MSDIAISVKNVSKAYRIWRDPSARLKAPLWDMLGSVVPAPFRPKSLQDRLAHHINSRYYRDFYALQDVSLEVKKGEALGIIGRNGSGKSTLLQMIAGTLTPTAGNIKVNGRVAALLELGSGFNSDFTGRENVFLNGSVLGIGADEMHRRYDEIVEFAGIGDFIDQPVRTYSTGMVVRLAFAVAASIEPDVLIVDEALSVGDMVFQQKCFRRFKQVRETGTSVVFVSHDLGSIIQFCDRAIVLQRGQLVGEGPAKAMADLYKKTLAEELAPVVAAASCIPSGTHKAISAAFQRNPNVQDYSNGGATIEDYGMIDDAGAPVRLVAAGRPITVVLRICFHQACHDPIAAFTIRDLKGNDIAGTNTWYEDKPIGRMRPGQVVSIRFRQELPLQAGRYALSLGCTEHVDGGLTVHHRLYDVLLFEVVASRRFVGVFDLQSETSIEVIKS